MSREFRSGDALAGLPQQQIRKGCHQRCTAFAALRGADGQQPGKSQRGILQSPRFEDIGSRQTEARIGCLQPRIAQQRDLLRTIQRQRRGQPRGELGFGCRNRRRARLHQRSNIGPPLFQRQACAAADQDRGSDGAEHAPVELGHGASPGTEAGYAGAVTRSRRTALGDQKMGGLRSGGRAAEGTDRNENGDPMKPGCGAIRAIVNGNPQAAAQWQLPASQQPASCRGRMVRRRVMVRPDDDRACHQAAVRFHPPQEIAAARAMLAACAGITMAACAKPACSGNSTTSSSHSHLRRALTNAGLHRLIIEGGPLALPETPHSLRQQGREVDGIAGMRNGIRRDHRPAPACCSVATRIRCEDAVDAHTDGR